MELVNATVFGPFLARNGSCVGRRWFGKRDDGETQTSSITHLDTNWLDGSRYLQRQLRIVVQGQRLLSEVTYDVHPSGGGALVAREEATDDR